MEDDRLSDYFSGRASTIVLAPGDPAAVVARAVQRRRRRRGVAAAAMVAVAAVGTGVIVASGPDGADVETAGSGGTTASALDWTVVEPESGLAFSRSIVGVDGSLYGLSTAPGALPTGDEFDTRTHLYRSADGREWTEVGLPDDLWASSLAGEDGQLYAVGTAPAGGGRELLVAASADGGTNWTRTTLPLDVAALEAEFPSEISVGDLSVAASGDTVVAAVVVRSNPDIARLLPDEVGSEFGYSTSNEGVEVYGMPEACAVDRRGDECLVAEPEVTARYTWDELALEPELAALLQGQLHVFRSAAGEPFAEVTVDTEVASSPRVMAADDGFRMVVQRWDMATPGTVSVLRSADGAAWGPDSLAEQEGYVIASGLLAGRPAIAIGGVDGTATMHVADAAGAWSSAVVPVPVEPGQTGSVGEVAFGPLGAVATAWRGNEHDPGDTVVIHTADGMSFSSLVVSDYVDDGSAAMSASVTADAFVVRLSIPDDADPATPPRQRLLVGTPT